MNTKPIFFFGLCIALTSPLLVAQENSAAVEDPVGAEQSMEVAGNWAMVIDGPMGKKMDTTLRLQMDNGVLHGTQSGQGETHEIGDCKIEGRRIFWTNKAGAITTLRFDGNVEGDRMIGTVKAGWMGSYPFTASRQNN